KYPVSWTTGAPSGAWAATARSSGSANMVIVSSGVVIAEVRLGARAPATSVPPTAGTASRARQHPGRGYSPAIAPASLHTLPWPAGFRQRRVVDARAANERRDPARPAVHADRRILLQRHESAREAGRPA